MNSKKFILFLQDNMIPSVDHNFPFFILQCFMGRDEKSSKEQQSYVSGRVSTGVKKKKVPMHERAAGHEEPYIFQNPGQNRWTYVGCTSSAYKKICIIEIYSTTQYKTI